jgi:hypothetical protein
MAKNYPSKTRYMNYGCAKPQKSPVLNKFTFPPFFLETQNFQPK